MSQTIALFSADESAAGTLRQSASVAWSLRMFFDTCLEGVVWREATGTEDEELKGYGDPRATPRLWRSSVPLPSLGLAYTSTRNELTSYWNGLRSVSVHLKAGQLAKGGPIPGPL